MKMKAYLESSKEEVYLVLDEKHIQETINKSIDIYCMNEQKRVLDYGEFLWCQLRHIRKRWCFVAITNSTAFSKKHGDCFYIVCNTYYP